MQKKIWIAALTLVLGLAWAGGNTTNFVVRMPEILWLEINGQPTEQVPVRVEDGRVSPGVLHVRVVGNTAWRLTVTATPLAGPLTLPPERLVLAGQTLSSLERTVREGVGSARFDLNLGVRLEPGEPAGPYEGLLTFVLYRL
ncbi:hypothetical protein Ocepr_0240 [Oceanithermus profundus DSM 14977]|uniref:DUF4402 domain-containing protein n=1 Tax=Oceanithermus profundus (strain DSM 14977 / NBRC 100410 / VKM B-2274 / 506) TaxID=670487 RepID=E4U5T8_OCEP5|nr:hypothetical protein [Oceanithermus profundus]ADR35702.1 hypothetical protein Ocepr_0240 [Oceanithermus profundus DSM 14977]